MLNISCIKLWTVSKDCEILNWGLFQKGSLQRKVCTVKIIICFIFIKRQPLLLSNCHDDGNMAKTIMLLKKLKIVTTHFSNCPLRFFVQAIALPHWSIHNIIYYLFPYICRSFWDSISMFFFGVWTDLPHKWTPPPPSPLDLYLQIS